MTVSLAVDPGPLPPSAGAGRNGRTPVSGFRPARLFEPVGLGSLPERPLVSVIVANYNYAAYVGQAIESALAQTYEHLEVIVCDDGSTDDSRQVIAAYVGRDPRVRLVTRPNGGMAAAWNMAYGASRGDIFCVLDADDTFLPTKVEQVVQRFARQPRSGLVVHPLVIVDGHGTEFQTIPIMPKVEEGWIADAVLRRGGRWRSVQTSGLSFRRDVAAFVFPIPEETFRRGPDGFVATLLPLLTEVSVVPNALARYRVHGRNDLGALRFEARAGRKVVDFVAAANDGVNARLKEIGLSNRRLETARNPGVAEYGFMLGLIEGRPRRGSLVQYLSLVRSLVQSDLYGGPQKLLKVGVYGVALVLPIALRARWINLALACGPIKGRVQRFAKKVGAGLQALRHLGNGDRQREAPRLWTSPSDTALKSGVIRRVSNNWTFLRTYGAFRESPLTVLARLLSWRIRCLLAIPGTVELSRWQIRFCLPAHWRGIPKLIFAFREEYERELGFLERTIEPGWIFADVGANIGIYTVAASRWVGTAGRVIAFEPSGRAFGTLDQNVRVNGLTNVTPHQLALSDRAGTARLHHHADPARHSLGSPPASSEHFEAVATDTLDRVLQQEAIDRLDGMKIDVEGAEELVLRGALSTLTESHPLILFEVNREATRQLGIAEDGAWNLLAGLGYEFFRVTEQGAPHKLAAVPTGGNVVAIHKERLE